MKGFINDKEQLELHRKQTGNHLAYKAAVTHGQNMVHCILDHLEVTGGPECIVACNSPPVR